MIIESLQLYSPNLKAQEAFYREVLGCRIVAKGDEYFEIELGYTRLRFVEDQEATPYHYALNIPSNQIEAATHWLHERVAILPGPDGDIVDFSSWRAKSVYFYDRDQNIVEFIARERIAVVREDPFDMTRVVSVSEIGMPVSDIKSVYKDLCTISPFPVFSGSFDVFCAVGNDDGLFIVIDRNKKNWFPRDDKAHSSDFSIGGLKGDLPFSFRFRNGQILN